MNILKSPLKISFLIFLFCIFIKSVYSLTAVNLYYWDLNSNSKIDRIGIEFDGPIKGIPDFSKIQLYSNTGGLSTRKINTETGFFSNFFLSGSFLYLDLVEQDNSKKDLSINNSTSSDLRLKSLDLFGITDLLGAEMTKLSLTSSFGNYSSSHIFNKTLENPFLILTKEETNSGSSSPDSTGSTDNSGSLNLDLTGSTNNSGAIFDSTGSSDLDSFTGSLTDSGDTDNSGSLSPDSTGSLSPDSKIDIPDIKYKFQVATYLLQKGEDYYECDKSKSDCKLNLDFEDSFSGGFRASDFICQIDFGFVTGEEGKCNPNTVIFGSGYFEVKLKIIDKNNFLNFKEKIFIVNNEIVNIPVNIPENIQINTPVLKKEIPEPIIDIQSGLDSNLSCSKENCSVNLDSTRSFSGITESDFVCNWNIPGAVYSGSLNSCNPSYIHYLPGSYSVTLRISDKLDSSNFKEKSILINNSFTKTIILSTTNTITNTVVDSQNIGFNVKILVQSIANSKQKILDNKTLSCFEDECSVNLLGEVYNNKNDIKYFWDFGNGAQFEGKNPKVIKYLTGIYNVSLKATDSFGIVMQDFLTINVLGKSKEIDLKNKNDEKIIKDNLDLDSILKYIRISSVMPNPKGADNLEWIELQNTGSGDINIKSCKIEAKSKSVKTFNIKNDLIISPNFTKKLYKNETKLSLNNGSGSIVLKCLDNIIDTLSWSVKILDDYVVDKTIFTGSIQSSKASLLGNNTNTGLLNNTYKIKVQGKLSKNKKIVGNTLYCETDKTCPVDFGTSSKKVKNFSYLWDLGNGDKYLGFAPKTLKYDSGKYETKLTVLDQNDQVISSDKLNLVVYKPVLNQNKSKDSKIKNIPKAKPKIKSKIKPKIKAKPLVDIKNSDSKMTQIKKNINFSLYLIFTSFIVMILIYFLAKKRAKIS